MARVDPVETPFAKVVLADPQSFYDAMWPKGRITFFEPSVPLGVRAYWKSWEHRMPEGTVRRMWERAD